MVRACLQRLNRLGLTANHTDHGSHAKYFCKANKSQANRADPIDYDILA